MAKSFEMRVKIVEVKDTEEVGNNGFLKREVIGMIEGEYPDYYKFEFIKDKTSIPDELIEGTYATMVFNIRGNKVEAKGKKPEMYFTSLQCWKVSVG